MTHGKRAVLYADGTNLVHGVTDPAELPTGAAQPIAYAASITPDAALGERVIGGILTGNLTISAPSNPRTGGMLNLRLHSGRDRRTNHYLERGVQEGCGRRGDRQPEGGDLVCL